MKVLIIQEAGRNEGNKQFRECLSLQRAFKHLDHDAVVWGKGHDNFNYDIDFNSYDIIFNLENYGDSWLPDLSCIYKPYKILWSIDAHCRGVEPYNKIFNDGKYNLLLHSTKDYATGSNRAWFPNAYDDTLIRKLDIAKQYFLGFCGNYVNRKQLIDHLTAYKSLKQDIFVIGDEMVKAINSYHIHFNKNIANDINYRSFETLGCGTLLLTNYNPQYEELGFIDFDNCVMYKNLDELNLRIDYLKNNPKLIEIITQNGFNFVKKHTYNKRVEKLLEYIKHEKNI